MAGFQRTGRGLLKPGLQQPGRQEDIAMTTSGDYSSCAGTSGFLHKKEPDPVTRPALLAALRSLATGQ